MPRQQSAAQALASRRTILLSGAGMVAAAVLSIGAGSAVGAVLVSLGGLAPPLVVTGACILLVTLAYTAPPASKIVSGDTHR